MEFIKIGKNYMIKNSPSIIVTEEEKLKLEKEWTNIKRYRRVVIVKEKLPKKSRR